MEGAIDELKQMSPDPHDHEEIGTRSEYSTELHLIVNWGGSSTPWAP